MKRSLEAADDKSAADDKAAALKYCDHICNTWPESDLYPTAELLASSILLSNESDAGFDSLIHVAAGVDL